MEEAIPSELDLFEKAVFQGVIIGEEDVIVPYINSLQEGAPITFFVPKVVDLYRDLNNSHVEIKCKITKNDGTGIDDDDKDGVVNLLGDALFKDIDLELKHIRLSNPTNLYPFSAYMETLTNYEKEILETRLRTSGWVKDTSGQNGNPDPTNHYGNNGLVKRSEKYKNSALVTLQYRPDLDLFHQEKLILGNVPLTIRLTPNNHSFSLKTAGQQHQCKIEICLKNVLNMCLFDKTSKI